MAYKILAGLENWFHNSILAERYDFNVPKLNLTVELPKIRKNGVYQECPKDLPEASKKLWEMRDSMFKKYNLTERAVPLTVINDTEDLKKRLRAGGASKQEDCDKLIPYIVLVKYFIPEISESVGLRCKQLVNSPDSRRSIRSGSQRIIYINNNGNLFIGYIGFHAGYDNACKNPKLFNKFKYLWG